MKRLLRRHLRLAAAAAVVLLAGIVAFALHAADQAHAQPAPARSSGFVAAGAPAVAAVSAPAGSNRAGRSGARGAARQTPNFRRAPLAPVTAARRPGIPTQAPSSRALAQALRKATGLSPSQVTTRDVCSPARADRASCAAEAVVLRSSGALVHPQPGAQPAVAQVGPGGSSPPAALPPLLGTPQYLQQAYDLAALSQSAGRGDTVAIVDAYDDPSAEADLAVYRAAYGLPACTSTSGCFRKVNQNGAASPLPPADSGWSQEISLDLDAVSAICPNCHILLVEANSSYYSDLFGAMRAASSLGANQISDSWSGSDQPAGNEPATFTGVATVAATGDSGYVDSGESYPASLPGVTAAGGTSVAGANGGPNLRGFTESAWSGAGSGCNTDPGIAQPSYQAGTGCPGRAFADISADADPNTGLKIYDHGSWLLFGGTSLATPMIAAYYALTGVAAGSPQWAYTDSSLLNDVVSGSNGACGTLICNAAVGYDGPTGVGSISGTVTTGAPGIGGPAVVSGGQDTYTESVGSQNATIAAGIYRNGLDTTWSIQYGTSTTYANQTPPVDVGAGSAPVAVTGLLTGLSSGTTYHYRLVARNALGTTYGYDYSFTTAPASAPTASFAATPGAPTPSSPVAFDASGSANGTGATITDYSWNFGDGTTFDGGTSPSTSHTFARGSYQITLTLTDSDGQRSSSTQTVTVEDPPTAAFSPSATLATPGSAISLDASGSSAGSGGTIKDYSWSFGDGSAQDGGSSAGTTHAFSAPGVYTVTLTTTDDLNVSASTFAQITVDQPTAAFTATPGAPAPGAQVTFDGGGSSDPQGTISNYSWDFGDGTPTESGTSQSHVFAARGDYIVRLTVTNSHGQTATIAHTVIVDNPPTAAFTPSGTLATPGAAIHFDGSASTATSGGSIATYLWNFGDGTTANTESPSHTYPASGTYNVTLTVTDELGASTTSLPQQVVVDQPTAAFSAPSGAVAPGTPAGFSATGSTDGLPSGTITDYTWSFGEQGTPNVDLGGSSSASHSYASRGAYTVTLTVTNRYGQTGSTHHTVIVDTPPTPSFTPSATSVAVGSTVSFDAGASSPAAGGSIRDYRWDFGDGVVLDTGATASVAHTFASAGPRTVTLTTTDDLGVSATASEQLTVQAPVVSPSPTAGPPPVVSPSPAPAPAPAPIVQPTPATAAPLSAALRTAKHQRLAVVAAHGLHVTVSLSAAANATFQITVPRNQVARDGASRKAGTLVLLRTRGQALTAGKHGLTIKLSRAALRELAVGRPVVLTVRMTLTRSGMAAVTRTIKLTLTR